MVVQSKNTLQHSKFLSVVPANINLVIEEIASFSLKPSPKFSNNLISSLLFKCYQSFVSLIALFSLLYHQQYCIKIYISYFLPLLLYFDCCLGVPLSPPRNTSTHQRTHTSCKSSMTYKLKTIHNLFEDIYFVNPTIIFH